MDFQPPDHLSERAKSLWRAVVPRRCDAPEELALLQTALESLDRSDQAAAAIAEDGLLLATLGSGTKHANPMIRVEKESKALFAKIWTTLNLSWVPLGKAPDEDDEA